MDNATQALLLAPGAGASAGGGASAPAQRGAAVDAGYSGGEYVKAEAGGKGQVLVVADC